MSFLFLLILPQPADNLMYQQIKPLMLMISRAGVLDLSS